MRYLGIWALLISTCRGCSWNGLSRVCLSSICRENTQQGKQGKGQRVINSTFSLMLLNSLELQYCTMCMHVGLDAYYWVECNERQWSFFFSVFETNQRKSSLFLPPPPPPRRLLFFWRRRAQPRPYMLGIRPKKGLNFFFFFFCCFIFRWLALRHIRQGTALIITFISLSEHTVTGKLK